MKNILVRLPLHVSVHIYDYFQGARKQYFVQLLNWIPLMYAHCAFVLYAVVCHYCRFVCVSGVPGRVRYGQRIHNTSRVLTCESLLLTCIHRTQRELIT
jgi:hypothetical protein